MKDIFRPGDKKVHIFNVTKNDIAAFNQVTVHEVCATFALAREIEWASRLFVLDMIEPDEEGIGTRLEIWHKGPGFVGDEVVIEASFKSLTGRDLLCTYTARVGNRPVAEGITGQKILKRHRLKLIARQKE